MQKPTATICNHYRLLSKAEGSFFDSVRLWPSPVHSSGTRRYRPVLLVTRREPRIWTPQFWEREERLRARATKPVRSRPNAGKHSSRASAGTERIRRHRGRTGRTSSRATRWSRRNARIHRGAGGRTGRRFDHRRRRSHPRHGHDGGDGVLPRCFPPPYHAGFPDRGSAPPGRAGFRQSEQPHRGVRRGSGGVAPRPLQQCRRRNVHRVRRGNPLGAIRHEGPHVEPRRLRLAQASVRLRPTTGAACESSADHGANPCIFRILRSISPPFSSSGAAQEWNSDWPPRRWMRARTRPVVNGTGLGNVIAELGEVRGVGGSGRNAHRRGVALSRRTNDAGVRWVRRRRGRLRSAGTILAGDLPAQKARLKLMLALAKYGEDGKTDDEALRAYLRHQNELTPQTYCVSLSYTVGSSWYF